MASSLPHNNAALNSKPKFGAWRFRMQVAALLTALLSPFPLFWGLTMHLPWLSLLCSALFVLALLLTIWTG
jgi:hypothetical protein